MNYIYRSAKSLLYRYKNTVLTLLIFIVLATLILSGICINQAAIGSEMEIRQSIGASITANSNMRYSDEIKGVNVISMEKVNSISSLTEVGYTSVLLESQAMAIDFKPFLSDQQEKEYTDMVNSIKVFGCTNTVDNKLFSEGSFKITMGEPLNEKSRNMVVVHFSILDKNNLSIGDKISIKSAYNDTQISLEIAGSYNSELISSNQGEPYSNYENYIFTSPQVAMQLNGDNFIRTAIFRITDPENINVAVEKATATENPTRFDDTIIFTKQNSEYKSVAGTLNSVKIISIVMVITSMIMGGAILSLLVMMNLKTREFEIGILLSMGESKSKILLQLIIESLLPVLIAITVSIVISWFTADIIGEYIGGKGLGVGITGTAVLMIYLAGILLTLIASISTVFKVVKYRPKDMLINTD